MWDTTYTTVMRLKSTEKYATKVNTKSEEKRPLNEYSETLTEKISEEAHKSTNEDLSNPILSAMTTKIVELGRARNSVAVKSPAGIQIPKLSVSFFQHTYNPKEKADELAKAIAIIANEDRNVSKRVQTEKLALSVSIPEVYSDGTLAYHMTISNLLRGDCYSLC